MIECEGCEKGESQRCNHPDTLPRFHTVASLTDALHEWHSLSDCADFCGSPRSLFP